MIMTLFNKSFYGSRVVAGGLVLFLLTQTACKKDFLDVDPQAQTPSEQFWQTQEDATRSVNAIYGALNDWEQTAFPAIAIESMGADEAEKGSSPGDATFMNDFDRFTVSPAQGQLQGFWEGQYRLINLANQVLANVPGINMDETLKNRYLAEAKFARAFSYFRLVRAFGDVPLRLSLPKDPTEYNIPRTPKAQVYAAIEKDLTEAAGVLPTRYGPADVGRATKGAALALQAKAAMYQTRENAGKWNDVLNLTNQVMTLGYSLFPDYEKLFRIENENNQESVFEIQASVIPSIEGASNSQYSQVQGVRGVSWGGWGFNVPTEELVNAYEPNDPRKDATIIFRGETTPEGDFIPLVGDNPRYNQKSYVPSSQHKPGFNEGAEQNFRVIRYADVLLMNAEAANELGQTDKAKQSLNLVRARVGLPPVTTNDKTALRQAIWRERRVELAMEYDRYFDVIRQGRGAEVFGPKGWVANKNEVWPIPQNEIDISAGVLTQNPGY
jgi:starch-binding outer membrane protein, SusD/RagB family